MLPELLDGATGSTIQLLVDPESVADLRRLLSDHHTDVLDQQVTPVGHGDFGASAPGTTLGANADLAHQHVVAALKEMAEGLAGFAQALEKASAHLRDVDEESAVATQQLDASLGRVDTTFDAADTQGTTAGQSTVGGQPDPSRPATGTATGPATTPTTGTAAGTGADAGGAR
ncbi:hypothetical protein P5P86_00130 [Nocardioides sp. BP30]|uniref:hypothetical protein n=1 Tax=Nocardioides sp. BP30 TaxID=3036374 RepID=UPI002468E77B|nr:hypothetical protein [Nocardioides sp. BP30]WGL52255.1 hypothetical protein P5P86_00130 [Nocardioides sp. BP30]